MPIEADEEEDDYSSAEGNIYNSVNLVCQFSGLNFEEALDLPTDRFLMMLKCQTLNNLNVTQQGRDYLKKCKRLRQKEIDDDALQKLH